MKIYSVCDKQFSRFGKVIKSPFSDFFSDCAQNISAPETGVLYKAGIDEFETDKSIGYYKSAFGEVDVQIGYCWGKNKILNALEWHNCSEINCALEDMVLLLADMRDMKGDTIDTKKVKAFLVKKGQAVEIYQTTLHFCPLSVGDNLFKSVVILPKGTNTPLEYPSQDKKLVAKNKWLICHPDCKKMVDLGRVVGLKGKNLQIK